MDLDVCSSVDFMPFRAWNGFSVRRQCAWMFGWMSLGVCERETREGVDAKV